MVFCTSSIVEKLPLMFSLAANAAEKEMLEAPKIKEDTIFASAYLNRYFSV